MIGLPDQLGVETRGSSVGRKSQRRRDSTADEVVLEMRDCGSERKKVEDAMDPLEPKVGRILSEQAG
jgi:hypothetical protein